MLMNAHWQAQYLPHLIHIVLGAPPEELGQSNVHGPERSAGGATGAAVGHAHSERPARVLQPGALRQQRYARYAALKPAHA